MAAGGSTQQLVYDSSVEGMFVRGLGPRMTNSCRDALLAAGLDVSKKLRPSYTSAEYERFIKIARQHLFPELRDEEAYHRMGRIFVEGYFLTTLGGAIRSVLRLLGPRRNVERLPQNFSGGTNYVKATLEKKGEGDYDLVVENVGSYPTFTQGSLQAVLESSGARDPKVTFTPLPDSRVRYHLRWTP